MPQQWKGNVFGLLGIVLSLLAFINEKDRLVAAVIFGAAIVFYIIDSFSDEVDKIEKRLNKLEEKLKIYNELIEIKANIEYLKREVGSK